MSVVGKVIGSVTGLIISSGAWWAAIAGFMIGHWFDRGGLQHHGRSQQRAAWSEVTLVPGLSSRYLNSDLIKRYCETLFLLLGRVTKLNGRVTERAIEWIEALMHSMNITDSLREQCIEQFRQGKQLDKDLTKALSALYWQIYSYEPLSRRLIELLVEAIYLDNRFNRDGWLLILEVSSKLTYPETELWQLRHAYEDRTASQQKQQKQQSTSKERKTTERAETKEKRHDAGRARPGARRSADNQRSNERAQFAEDDFTWSRMGRVSNRVSEAQALYIMGISAVQWQTYNKKRLKSTYRKLMSQHHPDKLMAAGASEQAIEAAKSRTQAIRSAYEQLLELL